MGGQEVGAEGDQKRVSEPLELGSQVTVSHLTWVLGKTLIPRKNNKSS